MRNDLLPWLATAGDLGDEVLEIGPGPGLSTDLLRELAPRITTVEQDQAFAGRLADRLAGTNVTVLCADATEIGLDGNRFSSVVCLSMLHHVPSAAHQDLLFSEANRMLAPGGWLLAADALDCELTRKVHAGHVFSPVPPETLGTRLAAAGFEDVAIEIKDTDHEIRFTARKK